MDKKSVISRLLEHTGKLCRAYATGDDLTVQKEALMQVVLLRLRAIDVIEAMDSSGSLFQNPLHQELVQVGEALCFALDTWQDYGATLEDLCNLCNRDYNQMLKKIPPKHRDFNFQALVDIYEMDSKDGTMDNAPLMRAVKAFHTTRLLKALRNPDMLN